MTTLGTPAVDEERTPAAHAREDRAMEVWISYVLRGGVLIAAAIILLGVLLFLIHGPGAGGPQTRAELTGKRGASVATSFGQVLNDARRLRPLGIIQLGLLALILTPMTRVAMTLALFLRQRDWIFVAITATVLTILVIGLIGVGA